MALQTLKALFAVVGDEHGAFIDIEAAAGVTGICYEPHQIEFLNNPGRFGIDIKARQIAWSFTAALDAVVDGILNPKTPHVFVSINLDEAKEKIRYAKAVIEAMRPDVRPELVRESTTEIEFANGSRLISHPCRPPRGKARTRIYLDEMAHYREGLDREIYKAALPATIRSDGYIRIGSSPMGASGLFWEIVTETLKTYPGYAGQRRYIYWWLVKSLCCDVKLARLVAPQMITEERVYTFGTPALIEIFENMLLEDFQQEYECAWLDESTAWITWDLIKKNQALHDGVYWRARSTAEALAMIPALQRACDQGKIEEALVGGIDVGRKHDLTELVVLGKSTAGRLPVRLMVSLDRVEYDAQEDCFREIIERLPFIQVLVDQSGIGAQLGENLTRTGKAQGVDFSGPSKELWAVETKIQAERGNVPLPPERDLAYQIHSIKKTVTAAKNIRFDTERNEKHHADMYWAWALAIWAGKAERRVDPGVPQYLPRGSDPKRHWGDVEREGKREERPPRLIKRQKIRL